MPRKGHAVLGTWVDALSWDDAIEQVAAWCTVRASRYVCVCNVHSVVTAQRDAELRMALDGADLSTSDGAPIAWAMRRLGIASQERIAGPDFMWRYLRHAERLGQAIFLYGSTDETLRQLRRAILRDFPAMDIRGALAPPFRAPLPSEDAAEIAAINASRAQLVFVSLGCPKQEKWMAAHRGKINAVMVGVGAAFDFHAGLKSRAPLWWQHHGLEWLYRLGAEPRRLARRYLVTNTLFVLGFARQLIARKMRASTQPGG
jgi:N-acetylglucosaminyldiphosphoundecaprenol N-acetyl-beta-D-mannosaminyltransferase